MRVKAIALGFYGSLREIGDEFDINGQDDLGSWMEPVGDSVEPEPEAESEAPATGQADGPAFVPYHLGAGRHGVKDASGERVGDFTGTKEEAAAEAQRLLDQGSTGQGDGNLPDA